MTVTRRINRPIDSRLRNSFYLVRVMERYSRFSRHASHPCTTELADAETPEALLKSLTIASKKFSQGDKKDHDHALQDGVAHALVRTLRNSLVLRSKRGNKFFVETLTQGTALRISIVCAALEKVLHCSDTVLVAYIEDLVRQDLLPTLAQVVDIYLPHDDSLTVRDVALSKTSRILYLVSKHALGFPADIVPTLGKLINAGVASDVRIDAACSIASLLAHPQINRNTSKLPALVSMLPVVISTLSTAAGSAPLQQRPEISKALLQVARTSNVALVKMSKRRDTIVNIGAFMHKGNTRTDALKIAALLLNCQTSSTQLRVASPSHGVRILQGLATVAQTADMHVTSQELAVAILISVVDSKDEWQTHQLDIALDALTGIAHSSASQLLRTEVSFGICRQLLKRRKIDEEARRLLPTIIDFLQFKIESIRLEALHTLEVCTRNQEWAESVMAEYSFIDHLSAVVTSNVKMEQNRALCILFNCSKYDHCTATICQSTTLLSALIDNATRQDVNKGCMWLKSLEIILNIMKTSSNHAHLKECTELLPWLALAANAVEGDDIKKRVVQAIIQLSHIYLDGGIPNRILV